ncbi:MAG: tetratricopeptide repeat protein [Chitinophagales bacterium]
MKHLVQISSTGIDQLATQGIVYFDHLYDPVKASFIFEEVLAAAPDIAAANYGMGKIYQYYENDPVNAALYYKRAIDTEPGHKEALQCYAILVEAKNPELAKELYKAALSFDPENPEVHFHFAILLKNFFRQELETAREHYVKAVSINQQFERDYLQVLFKL